MLRSIITSILSALALVDYTVAFQQAGSRVRDVTSSPALEAPAIHLDNMLVRNTLPESMQETLDMILNVQSMHSCSQIAASALLHSCSALEGSIQHDESNFTRGSDLFVDEESDIFAARLAVCELKAAEFQIPKPCQSFIPSENKMKKRGIRGFWSSTGPTEPNVMFQQYDKITQAHLQQCRKALGSSPQSWTSYSNSKQNAVVMCRSVRSEIEKDEQIHLSKLLSEIVSKANFSLQEALLQVEDIQATFRKISAIIPQFQADLAFGNEKQLTYVRQFWADIERAREELNTVFEEVHENARKTSDDIKDLGNSIKAAARNSATDIANLVSKPKEEIGQLSMDIVSVAELVDFAKESMMQGIIQALYNVTEQVNIIDSIMPRVMDDLALMQSTTNQTKQDLEKVQKELHGAVQVITDFFEHEWASMLPHVSTIVAVLFELIIGTLAGFSLIYQYFHFRLISAAAAGLVTGLLFAWICSLFDILRCWQAFFDFTKVAHFIDLQTIRYIFGISCATVTLLFAINGIWRFIIAARPQKCHEKDVSEAEACMS